MTAGEREIAKLSGMIGVFLGALLALSWDILLRWLW